MVTARLAVSVLLCAACLGAAPGPRGWIPLRWDGGPLELLRRQNEEARRKQEAAKAPEAKHKEPVFPLSEEQKQAIRDWYRPDTLELLEGTPYNCVLLSWSLGSRSEFDADQRERVAGIAAQARQRGLAVLAVVEFGPDWPAAVEAAAADFDGAVLEGEFPEGAAEQALETLRGKNPDAVVVPMGSWEGVNRDPRFPILASGDGLWPGLLTATEAEGWGAGPTSNPWVLSNGWRVGALRADGSQRPVWMGHRPRRHRPQPLEYKDFVRAVADTGMAGGRWVVTLGDEWRRRLYRRDPEALAEWRQLAAYVQFFEDRSEWRAFPVWPSVVVVHDPRAAGDFDSFDILNMLAVRHVPHRVVLRNDFAAAEVEPQPAIVAFDLAPPSGPERQALQGFTQAGGTLLLGPHWSAAKGGADEESTKLIAGAGSIRAYAGEKIDSDKFSRDVRDILDKKHAAPKLYNVGSVISQHSYDPASGRVLLQMTEYGDYPTENITVKFPRKFSHATLYYPGQQPEELRIYEGEGGGVEIDVPKVPFYCAVVLD